MTSYRSIVETYQNASRLYEEVKEAEGIIFNMSIVYERIRCYFIMLL